MAHGLDLRRHGGRDLGELRFDLRELVVELLTP
jgi:hypothetical protein